MSGGQQRSINIPAANYVFFGAGEVLADESWLMPYESQATSLTSGSEAGATSHVQRDGVLRRMTISQTTPTVQPVVYTLQYFDRDTVAWVDTSVIGHVAVGESTGMSQGSFATSTFDLIRIRVNKAPAEPAVNLVRVFVELA